MTTIAQERQRLIDVQFYDLISREDWGARFDDYDSSRPVEEPADNQHVHISVTNPDNYSSDAAHIRAIEAIGISRFPATGVSYNRGFTQSGKAYELQPIGRRGAHTVNDFKRATCTTTGCPSRGGSLQAPSWNNNINGRAYVFAANVDDEATDELIDAMARSMAADRLAGFVRKDAGIHGHRCCSSKSCPGNKLWARIRELAALVAHYIRVGLGGGTVTPEEDFMGFIDNQAEFNTAMARALEVILEPKGLATDPEPVHRALTYLRAAPWHQQLGRSGKNMHEVMGLLLNAATVVGSLPELIRESGDEIGLSPEQTEQLAASVASKVERVTVVVED